MERHVVSRTINKEDRLTLIHTKLVVQGSDGIGLKGSETIDVNMRDEDTLVVKI